MSCYMVNREHIDALVELAINGPSGIAVSPDNAWARTLSYHTGLTEERGWLPERHEVTEENADVVGQMLAHQNAESVRARYRPLHEDGQLQLPEWADEGYTFTGTRFTPYRTPTALEGLKLIQCYEYQACETGPLWYRSQAKAFCGALLHRLIQKLDGYRDAPRDWTRADAGPEFWTRKVAP